jgi:hypothetical protein
MFSRVVGIWNPTKEEAFMTLLLTMTDTRKRVAILCLLSFLALC